MKEILLLEPVFADYVWGGNALASYGYRIPEKRIGEVYGVSARPDSDCKIINGFANGTGLCEFYKTHRDWFGEGAPSYFPFSMKMISADMDTDVFVCGPDASTLQNGYDGSRRTEYMLVLDCPEHTNMITGHNAATKEDAAEQIRRGNLKTLIRESSIRKGDVFRMDYGTLQGFRPGSVLFSVSLAPNVRYRLSGNSRNGQNDFGREQKMALDALRVPSSRPGNMFLYSYRVDHSLIKRLVKENGFLLEYIKVSDSCRFHDVRGFSAYTVLAGNGTVDGLSLKAGDSFIVPYNYGNYELKGSFELIRCFYA